jgi:hypothetical protein
VLQRLSIADERSFAMKDGEKDVCLEPLPRKITRRPKDITKTQKCKVNGPDEMLISSRPTVLVNAGHRAGWDDVQSIWPIGGRIIWMPTILDTNYLCRHDE